MFSRATIAAITEADIDEAIHVYFTKRIASYPDEPKFVREMLTAHSEYPYDVQRIANTFAERYENGASINRAEVIAALVQLIEDLLTDLDESNPYS